MTDPTTPNPSLGVSTNPTTCEGVDGSIQLTNLTASTNYTINYKRDMEDATPATIMTNGVGQLTIPSLIQGSYTDINVTLNGLYF